MFGTGYGWGGLDEAGYGWGVLRLRAVVTLVATDTPETVTGKRSPAGIIHMPYAVG